MAILNYNDLNGFTPQTNLPITFLLPTHTFAPQLITYVSSYLLHATFTENFMALFTLLISSMIHQRGFFTPTQRISILLYKFNQIKIVEAY